MPMQMVDDLVALPGKCYGCGTSEPERGPWLDTGIDKDQYGVIYFCTLCLNHITSLAGYITPEVADDLKLQVLTLSGEKMALENRVDALEKAIHALTEAGYSGISDYLDSSSSSYNDAVPELPAEPELPFREERLEERADGSSEQDSEQGLADVRSVDESDNPFEL